MPAIRRLLSHRRLAAMLCAVTLALKLLVPTGYMIGSDHGQPAITICSGMVPSTGMMVMPGMHHDASRSGKSGDHGKTEAPCAFAGLSATLLGAAGAIQLTALFLFIVAAALLPGALPLPWRRVQLRPPLRGPPATL